MNILWVMDRVSNPADVDGKQNAFILNLWLYIYAH